jgi:hypothetical protein
MNKLMERCYTTFPLHLYECKKTYSIFNEQIFNSSLFQLYNSLSLLLLVYFSDMVSELGCEETKAKSE